jgi:hypothetical protein
MWTALSPTRSVRRTATGVLVVAALVTAWRLWEDRAPSLAFADSFLQGPSTLAFPDERGQPIARCRHTNSPDAHDACTLTFPAGDAYPCSVFLRRIRLVPQQAATAI